jgi:GntR family transcriptional regulator, transcriptional repressor for pyruvate dehydrogenase complex
MAWVKPVTQTLGDLVTDAILRRIAQGDFKPGMVLPPQRELASELGVGLAVIREAIQRLQVLQVVRTRHGSGTTVEPIRWQQLVFQPVLRVLAFEPEMQKQIWEARHAIERETARLAAVRGSQDAIAAIASVVDLARRAPPTFEENQTLNTQFHLSVARAAGNSILLDLLGPLLEIGFTTPKEGFDETIIDMIWSSHAEIFAAISARNVAAVDVAIERHSMTGNLENKRLKELWGITRKKTTAGQAPFARIAAVPQRNKRSREV